MKTNDFQIGIITGLLTGLVTGFVFLINVWTVMFLWNWFVAPLGMAEIGFFHALGLILVLTYLLKDSTIYIMLESTDEQRNLIFLISFIFSCGCLILGWLIHLLC